MLSVERFRIVFFKQSTKKKVAQRCPVETGCSWVFLFLPGKFWDGILMGHVGPHTCSSFLFVYLNPYLVLFNQYNRKRMFERNNRHS
jgi:hypothetical protein